MRVSLLLAGLLAAIGLVQAWSLNDNDDALADSNTNLLASLREEESPLVSTFADTDAANKEGESGSDEDKTKKDKKKKKKKKKKNKKGRKLDGKPESKNATASTVPAPGVN